MLRQVLLVRGAQRLVAELLPASPRMGRGMGAAGCAVYASAKAACLRARKLSRVEEDEAGSAGGL